MSPPPNKRGVGFWLKKKKKRLEIGDVGISS